MLREPMSFNTIRCDIQDRILTVTLSRPEKLNAYTLEMSSELEHAFAVLAPSPDVKAVIVTGEGNAFCAGMDLSGDGDVFGFDERHDVTLDELPEVYERAEFAEGIREPAGRVTLAIYRCPKPVIGAINGPAVGVGSTLILPMDLRIASTNARFGFVFGRVGIVPEGASTWFLPRLVGYPKTFEWLYGADIFSAAEAQSAGLIQAVHSPDDLIPQARRLALRFVDGRSAASTALIRQMVWRNSAARDPSDANLVETRAVRATSRLDGEEGVRAFLEKRSASFSADVGSLPPDLLQWLKHSRG